MAKNVMLLFPNVATKGTVSGGTWQASAPIGNVLTPILGIPAVSNGLTLVATQFDLALDRARPVAGIGLGPHNLSSAAKVRILAADNAAFTAPILDTGWQDAWDRLYPFGTRAWEDPMFWDGKPDAETRALWNAWYIRALSSVTLARYWRFQFDDTSNTDGEVRLGSVFLAAQWVPERNADYGAALGLEDKSEVVEGASGAEFHDVAAKHRTTKLEFSTMTEDDAMAGAFDLIAHAGTTQRILFVWDPDDTYHRQRRSFLARITTTQPVARRGVRHWHAGIELREVL